jgi:D-glycero-D-manno-heptose 1,7-bisphosphate phosphatase
MSNAGDTRPTGSAEGDRRMVTTSFHHTYGSNRAVFLDRDGTIIEDRSHIGEVEHVMLIPGAAAALRQLQDAGYRLFIVTNQSGVGRGYFPRESVEAVHAHLDQCFAKAGVRFDGHYVCPHHPQENCDCRKPKPKFPLEAAREHRLDLSRCFTVGDRPSDIQLGINAGTRTILVLTGVGRDTLANQEVKPDFVAEDIGAAAAWILTDRS